MSILNKQNWGKWYHGSWVPLINFLFIVEKNNHLTFKTMSIAFVPGKLSSEKRVGTRKLRSIAGIRAIDSTVKK
jgi:hypothetical protein